MGLLDLLFRSGNTRNLSPEQLKVLREPKSKYYRLVQALSITFLVLSGLLLLLNYLLPVFTGNGVLQTWILKICLMIVAICGGGLCCLPWIYFLERGKKLQEKGETPPAYMKKVCMAFFIAIGVCVLLWIVAVFIVHLTTFEGLIDKTAQNATGETVEGAPKVDGALGFLTFAVLFSIQVAVGSNVTASIFRYKNKHKVIRIINYVCVGLTDFWASWVAGAFFTGNLYRAENRIMIPLDPASFVLVIGILAVVGMVVSAAILSNMVRRDRLRAAYDGDTAALSATEEDFIQGTYEKGKSEQGEKDKDEDKEKGEEKPSAHAQTAGEKLRELKQLVEDGILSEEEYEEKKKEILSKM